MTAQNAPTPHVAWPKDLAARSRLYVFDGTNRAFLDGTSPRMKIGLQGRRALVGAGVLLFITALLAAVGVWQWRSLAAFEGSARTGEAQIVSRRESYSTDDDGDRTYYYHVTFTFSAAPPDGEARAYTVEQLVPHNAYNDLIEGSWVSIRFAPDEPSTATLVQHDTVAGNAVEVVSLCILIGGMCLLVAAILIAWAAPRLWRQARLIRRGRWIAGCVVWHNLEKKQTESEGTVTTTYTLKARIEFATPEGQTLSRTLKRTSTNKALACPHDRQAVAVRYLNDSCFEIM